MLCREAWREAVGEEKGGEKDILEQEITSVLIDDKKKTN